MAINFLDGITVDSGTGSAATIVAAGARPITLTGGGIGSVAIKGSNGGWATGYLFTGNSGTNRGGFGALGNVNNLTYFYIGDAYNDTTMIVQPNAGSVGIGTTSPNDGDLTIGTPKLHVAVGGTSGTFNLAARFQSTTSDADNTGTSILINSSNDRGLLIKAGRKDGDREVAYFDVVTSIGNTTNMLTMGKFDSAYNVGIGTATPATKLDVNGDTIVRGNVGINGATSIDSPLDIAASSTGNNALFQKWYYSPNAETYYLKLKQTVTAGVVRYNFSMVNNSTAYDNVLVLDRGKVGIGTTSPGAILHVRDTSGSTSKVKMSAASNDANYGYLTMTDNTANTAKLTLGTTYGYSTDVDALTIFNGNVGVGTTSPGEKLEVSGTAKATSVRATGGGDGGFVLRQWTYAANYASLATNGMSGLEYCMISDGTNTFIGSGANGTTRLRGPANDNSPQLEMTSTLCKIDAGDLKVEDGSLAVGNITNSTTDGRIDASNDIVAYSTSDIRLKDNIKTIDKALDKVNSIQGIEFDWIEKEEVHGNSGHDIGVIAQEIEKILPDVVTTRDNGYKAVKYEKIVPLLIEAIKDLSKQVDGLKRLI